MLLLNTVLLYGSVTFSTKLNFITQGGICWLGNKAMEKVNTHDWNNDKPYECGLETLEGGFFSIHPC